MKQFFFTSNILLLLIILFMMVSVVVQSQERADIQRSKNLFVEGGGSGIAILTVNYDFRFVKGCNEGLGMRIGIGGESNTTDLLLVEGEKKNKFFTTPLEVNYIFEKSNLSFEIGYSLTYVAQNRISSYSGNKESENLIVSYLPVGFRLKPKTNGFMLKFNAGPLINYSAPNIFSHDKIQFWAGLAIGYSFY